MPDVSPPTIPPGRQVFCSRTLNLRSIDAIGYDMDYTLVHYRIGAWERSAYEHVRDLLVEQGWPVAGLEFDRELIVRGLILDIELGNIVKANRFGYVTRAFHGTGPLAFEDQRAAYRHTAVDLGERRYVFLNTLFSLSEGCLYAQLVDLLDAGMLPDVQGYADLYWRVRRTLDHAHVEGTLKARIIADPGRYVEPDPDAPLALLDQREAGKRLMVVTNAEWTYTAAIMAWAFDPHLPPGVTWSDLFELVIVGARKPDFFTSSMPMFQIVDPSGLLRPLAGPIPGPGCYLGGDANLVEDYLGLFGDRILFVGDHIWADVRLSKSVLRWRTALILRELEEELAALEAFRPNEARLASMMAHKERLEARQCAARLAVQRRERGYGPGLAPGASEPGAEVHQLRTELEALDVEIAPLAKATTQVANPNWGPLLRAGNDKSHLARQLERSADIYTSRVSNFLFATPFAYLRARRGSMPHDLATPPDPAGAGTDGT